MGKNSFRKEIVENADLHKPVLKKIMTAQEQCLKYNFVTPLMFFKGAVLGLRHLLATESPLKMMKNVFYFTENALFVLKIFSFGHVAKRLDKKGKVLLQLL